MDDVLKVPQGAVDLTPTLDPLACACGCEKFVVVPVFKLRPVIGTPGRVSASQEQAFRCAACNDLFDGEAADAAARLEALRKEARGRR